MNTVIQVARPSERTETQLEMLHGAAVLDSNTIQLLAVPKTKLAKFGNMTRNQKKTLGPSTRLNLTTTLLCTKLAGAKRAICLLFLVARDKST